MPVTLVRMEEHAQIGWMGTSVPAQWDTMECIVKPVSFYASITVMIIVIISSCILLLALLYDFSITLKLPCKLKLVYFPLQSTNVPVTLVRMEGLAQIGWMGTSVPAQQDTQEHYARLVSFYAIMIMIMIVICSCSCCYFAQRTGHNSM